MTLQELSFKNNNCRIYQTEVSRTIIAEFSEIQVYSEVNNIVIPLYLWTVWTRQCVGIYIYLCCDIILIKPDYIAAMVVLFTESLYILYLPLESYF